MAKELDVAVGAALKAGKLLMRRYGRASIHYKADRSIVTAADLESERLIRSIVKGRFKDDAFLGEEMGFRKGSTGRT